MVLLDTPFTNDNMTDPTVILFIMTKASTKLSSGAEPGLKHRGANLDQGGHTLLMSNISNEIREFYVKLQQR